jgi:hypothetical protein
MDIKKCEKCGENVDAAKAFCPECGNPFVEEQKREESSEFDKYAGTIKYSKSVYKMMLSEMELDTSKQTEKESKPIAKQVAGEIKPPQVEPPEIVQPIPPQTDSPQIEPHQIESPQNNSPQNVPSGDEPVHENKKSGMIKWVILGVFGLAIPVVLVIIILAVLYIYFL